MQFLPGGTVTGRIEFQGRQAPPDPTKLRVSLTSQPAIPGTGGRVTPVALCVVTDIEPEQLDDRQLLEQLAHGSIPISLGEGEQKVQDVKIGGLPADTGR
jgi:hypothetical protein